MAVLKLLRNQTLYATHDDALTAINRKAEELGDGELWVATYGEAPNAKSILALKREGGLTVFDNETSSESITAAISRLNATVGSTTVGNDKHVAVQVVEENGKLKTLTIVEDDIASAALLGTTSDDDSKETAFGYIAKEAANRTDAIQALHKEDTPVAKNFVTSVSEANGLISVNRGAVTSRDNTVTLSDGSDGGIDLAVHVDGTTIVKSSGSLAVGAVPAANVSVADTDEKFEATNVEAALSELKDDIASIGGEAKSYTIVKQTTGLETNVKEQYRLQQTIGKTSEFVGETIKIYKDSSLKEVYLGSEDDEIDAETGVITKQTVTDPQSMNFAYRLADGTYELVKIDVSKFLTESEFGEGLAVSDEGVVSVKFDETSEKDSQTTPADFLTIGANGIKIQGIGAEIDRKIAALDVTDDAAVAGQYVAAIKETDGVVAVKTRANVSDAVLNGYAKGTKPASTAIAATDDVKGAIAKLEHQVDDAKAATTTAIEALDFTDTPVDSQYVTKVDETDGKITVARADVSAAKLNNYQKGTDELPLAATDTINQAFSKIEVTIENNENVAASALNDINSRIVAMNKTASAVAGQVVTTVSETDGVVSEAKANVKDLQLGGYSKTADTGAIAGTDTINVAFSKLENTVNTANDGMLTGITGSNAITVSTKTNKNQTVSLKLDATTKPQGFTNADNALSITSDGLYLSSIIDCGSY